MHSSDFRLLELFQNEILVDHDINDQLGVTRNVDMNQRDPWWAYGHLG